MVNWFLREPGMTEQPEYGRGPASGESVMNPSRQTRSAYCAVFIAALVFTASCGQEQNTASGGDHDFSQWPTVDSPIAKDPAMEERIDELIAEMTLEEKIGQMIQADIRGVTPGDVRKYHLGAVLNGGESAPGGTEPNDNKLAPVAEWAALAQRHWQASMDASDGHAAIPIMWGTDAVHGHANVAGATVFPHNIGLGAANDPALMRRIGEITAREVAVTGLDWNFAPTVAAVRDDRWGRTYEGYSESPAVVKNLAGDYVKGLQGDFGPAGVIATAKHFIADGGTERGDDRGNAVTTPGELKDIHLPGFEAALNAGAQSVMISYGSWNGTRMHVHRELITGLLKEHMGFDGLVISDWEAIDLVPACSLQSCPEAVNAGIDMFMFGDRAAWKGFIENTLEQVKDGTIPAERIDEAVTRILRVKMRAGLFDQPAPADRPLTNDLDRFGSDAHRAVAREAVRRSLVLLKNRESILPLSRDARVLVAGKSAHDYANQTGGWTITWQNAENTNSDFRGATSVWEGIEAIVPGAVLSEDGAVANGGESFDAAIAVIGETPYAEERGDLEDKTLEHAALYPEDLALLDELNAAGIPVVTVFISGRPLYVNKELNRSEAFVAAWLPGSEGGGIADVLFKNADGEIHHDFTGKLAFSWPAEACQTAVNIGDRPYTPLFPLGHGLTYADHEPLGDELPEASADAPCR